MVFDTVVSLATPPGEGAIGIIRISGSDSLSILKRVFRSASSEIRNRMLHYGHVIDPKTEAVVDEVMAVYMKGPSTYTKEDIVEIHCHGGAVSIYSVLKLLLSQGARAAEPGEFTKRAFLNGRIDLSQAEAVMDIVSAKTEGALGLALSQLDGGLSKKIRDIRDEIIGLLGNLEVSIDYPEEDIEEITYGQVDVMLAKVSSKIDDILKNSESGKIMREGINVVIAGRPNVGKSSLLNRLLRENRAIVTDIAGTTRDVIEEYLNIRGIPVKIVDTAGIRETKDVVEKIGVEKSHEFIKGSDLVILVLNGAEGIVNEDIEIIRSISDKKTIVLSNKTDIDSKVSESDIRPLLDHEIFISASMTENEGIAELEDAIFELVSGGAVAKSGSSPLVSNARHIDSLKRARASISDAQTGAADRISYDFLQVDIKDAYDYLGEITGDTAGESLLENIFSRFCLGK